MQQLKLPDDVPPFVLILDDDDSIRDSLCSLFRSQGLRVKGYASTSELLAESFPDAPTCLILDVHLKGSCGLDLQKNLNLAGVLVPIVFISGDSDIAASVKAMKAGAVDFFQKPFREQDLLDAVAVAINLDRRRRSNLASLSGTISRYSTLTRREKAVMRLAVTGRLNKQIAGDLGISEVTVKSHRGNATKKMEAKTFASLIHMSEQLTSLDTESTS